MKTWKLIALPLAQKILRVLLTSVGTAISTWLVARNLVSAGDKLTIVNLCADAAPSLLGALPGAAFDVWVWLNKFTFIVQIEEGLHLPVTGQPAAATVAAAVNAKDTASAVFATATSAAVDRPMFDSPPTQPTSQR